MRKQPGWLPWIVLAVSVLYLGAMAMPRPDDDGGFQRAEFGALPVQDGGRVKPFDSLARVKLMLVSHRTSFTHEIVKQDPHDPEKEIVVDDFPVSAVRWALDTMIARYAKDKQALDYRVFRIDNPDVVEELKLKRRPGSWRYSLMEIGENESFFAQVKRLRDIDGPRKDDIFENKIAELFGQYRSFMALADLQVRMLPPDRRERDSEAEWLTLQQGIQEFQRNVEHRGLINLMGMLRAYADGKPDEFNQALAEYQKQLERTRPREYAAARVEAFFNRFAPFYHSAILYGGVLVLGLLSWLALPWSRSARSAAFYLCALTFVVHTWALITRIYLTGRPPVTNLYSSAIFIGWGCVGLAMFLEWIYRNGIGLVVGSVTGMLSLIVAHNLVTGDTMEMLEAVLDTNFWLATHVICITFGYTTMFVAGFLGILYVILGKFTPQLRGQGATDLTKMIYGVVCFATLLSFVGTVLGGIWADESWGRFWGWDPKENGALLIVIWAALVLHARWGGMVKARGMANLVIFGNCVTAWSWFGTNLLGVGLHSYGFMKGAMLWLLVFVFTQMILIGIGCTNIKAWKSFAAPTPPSDDPKAPPTTSARATVAVPT